MFVLLLITVAIASYYFFSFSKQWTPHGFHFLIQKKDAATKLAWITLRFPFSSLSPHITETDTSQNIENRFIYMTVISLIHAITETELHSRSLNIHFLLNTDPLEIPPILFVHISKCDMNCLYQPLQYFFKSRKLLNYKQTGTLNGSYK